jgi:uncharacterized damage-inducible protein DinB
MYTIQKHLQYNAWADGKIAEILSNVDDKLLDKEIISSFPSIRKTVFHIWDAEQLWLGRLKGETFKGWPSAGFKGDTKALMEGYQLTSRELCDLAAGKQPEYFAGFINYKNTKGIEFTNSIEDILFHVVNHGTYHRGQLITMLRQQGIENFPGQDLIAYVREQQAQTV